MKTSQSLEVGKQLVGPIKTLTLERLRAFSGWPNKNVHTDMDVARKCGFEAPIASGAMFEGYITDMMLEVFGDDWLHYGKIEVTFFKPVYSGDKVQIMAKVKSKSEVDDKVKFEIEVWGENHKGEKVFTGLCIGSLSYHSHN